MEAKGDRHRDVPMLDKGLWIGWNWPSWNSVISLLLTQQLLSLMLRGFSYIASLYEAITVGFQEFSQHHTKGLKEHETLIRGES